MNSTILPNNFPNNNNNNNNRNNNIPKKRRWYRRNKKNVSNNTNIEPVNDVSNTQKRLKQTDQSKIDNDAQVARMEQQLHEYFQSSNTPYTFINDDGIYKFSKKTVNHAANAAGSNNNNNNNTNNPTTIPQHTQSTPLFTFFPCNPFMTTFPYINEATIPNNTKIQLSDTEKSMRDNSANMVFPAPAPAPAPAPPPPPPTNDEEIKPSIIIEEVCIQEEINHIDDLIALCDKYPLSESKKYNVNMKAIHSIREPLLDLSQMIGMNTLKRNIVDQILYYIQELHICPPNEKNKGDISSRPVMPPPPPLVVNDAKMPGLLNPFAPEFKPSGGDISARMNFDTKINPFGNIQPIFDFNALNNKFADSIKKKNGFGCDIGVDFSQPTSGDFMHTVIYGPPGSGKTEVAKIIGRIFSGLGILSKNTFKKVSRHDLVAGYLGQTAIKTKEIIKASLGGVLFIDEAYSLGNSEKRDSFAKECIDTLCEALSEYKNDWMVIVAGYEKELNDCFFNFNEGLNSRFTWRFKLDGYKAREMKEILEKKVRDYNWMFLDGEVIQDSWFASRMDYFTTYGRDMETLFTKIKIAHSRRVFCLPKTEKTKITIKDLENGFALFLENPEVKDRKERGGMGVYMKSLYV